MSARREVEMAMNILFLSAGRRCELLKDFHRSMNGRGKIVAADASMTAPALYIADEHYLVPRIDSPDYLGIVLDICRKEQINVVTTLIDPEIVLLAAHREEFEAMGVLVLAPSQESAELCFDKYRMYRYLLSKGIRTVRTYGSILEFEEGFSRGEISFPVFVKPRTGSGSVEARVIEDRKRLMEAFAENPSLIVQEYMGDALDLDADVYVDTVSGKPVAIFGKRKLERKIGGASKTISYKGEGLVEFVKQVVAAFAFNGPLDMDLWYRKGDYYLSEINPRFGGAYLHAYGAGVDFVKLIEKNLEGIENEPYFDNYEENIVMMMYDSVVIQKLE